MKLNKVTKRGTIPPDCILKVYHLHQGNDRTAKRRREAEAIKLDYIRNNPCKYATVALIISKAEDRVLSKGVAICNRTDQPNRRRGYKIAVGRAIMGLHKDQPHYSFRVREGGDELR